MITPGLLDLMIALLHITRNQMIQANAADDVLLKAGQILGRVSDFGQFGRAPDGISNHDGLEVLVALTGVPFGVILTF